MKLLFALVIAVAAAAASWALQSPPYRLDQPAYAYDQAALAHADSAYASSTWVASATENYLQLRFFDRVEGGVCLQPTWADLAAIGQTDPRLAHLIPQGGPPGPAPGEASWPNAWTPDPGTLPNTRYVCLFPAAVLLNERLVAAAGEAGARGARVDICIVGLGSGVGIGVYAHHFAEAAITVVDIDPTVIALVRAHYPLLRWLEAQKTSDGRARLTLVAQDARQYIQTWGRAKAKPFDVIVLDAYTSGSTIPPHLMTCEFYSECATALGDDGILLSNIIGSYRTTAAKGGTKYKVLGGAMRAMRAAGLVNLHNLPVLRSAGELHAFNDTEGRNNVVLASRQPLDPKRDAAGWERLRAFVPFPELTTGKSATTTETLLVSDGTVHSSTVPTSLAGDRFAALRARFTLEANADSFGQRWRCNDSATLADSVQAVLAGAAAAKLPVPHGWVAGKPMKTGIITRIDWVDHARQVWNSSIQIGRDALAHGGDALVGSDNSSQGACVIRNVPLFTDARPNADIYNTGE